MREEEDILEDGSRMKNGYLNEKRKEEETSREGWSESCLDIRIEKGGR
jgi:hypothetical protein